MQCFEVGDVNCPSETSVPLPWSWLEEFARTIHVGAVAAVVQGSSWAGGWAMARLLMRFLSLLQSRSLKLKKVTDL